MPSTNKAKTVVFLSDIHWPYHNKKAWSGVRKYITDQKPDIIVVGGDFVDLPMYSKYIQESTSDVTGIPHIRQFASELSFLAKHCKDLYIIEGNHEERWDKMLQDKARELYGALGLTLREQFVSHGLRISTKDKPTNIHWRRESAHSRDLNLFGVTFRHGHNQSLGSADLAHRALSRHRAGSVVFGHHHRAQLFAHTSQGITHFAVANPCLTVDHNYNKDPNWQTGFTVLSAFKGRKGQYLVTPNVVLIQEGKFVINNKLYVG